MVIGGCPRLERDSVAMERYWKSAEKRPMERCIEPELLDELAPEDPGAVGSRRDLRRLNKWMGHARIMARALRAVSKCRSPVRIVELGAGDGTALLEVATRLNGSSWISPQATLLDRYSLVSQKTVSGFNSIGWAVQTIDVDVFDWLNQSTLDSDVILANLFLHHFAAGEIANLFRMVAQRSKSLIALEPRRGRIPLAFSHLLGCVGCNAVTRHDAPASVRSGFRDRELSQLWP